MKIQRIFTSIILGLGLILSFIWFFTYSTLSNVYAHTFVVNNINAGGSGSLRQAIIDTNNRTGHDVITFAPEVIGTIVLTDSLPAITDDLTINGPGPNHLAISGDHLYRVFFIRASTAVTLTEITIQEGYAGSGGGIWSAGDLQLYDSLIFNNEASSSGGGVFVDGGNVQLTGTQVISNVATSRGGGIYMWGNTTTFAMYGGEIKNNLAGYSGGGICVERGIATFTDTQVISNSAQAAGGGIFVPSGTAILVEAIVGNNSAQAGGGIFVEGATASVKMLNSQVVDNQAVGISSWGGGGLYVERGAANLVNTHFVDNEATGNGGGISALFGNVVMTGTQVISNKALKGGGLYMDGNINSGSSIEIDNAVIVNNEATGGGGGIHFKNNHIAQIRHNTIVGNSGESGVYVEANGTVNITNTILVSHSVGITVATNSTATLENTLWANTIDWGGTGILITGTVNLWGDPDFVAPEIGDYHISQSSAALDAAVDSNLSIDIDGDPRPIKGIADIGADERKLYIYLPMVASNN